MLKLAVNILHELTLCGPYPNFAFYSNSELLKEPYGDWRTLLKETEDEVDRWEEDFSASTAAVVSAGHAVKGLEV